MANYSNYIKGGEILIAPSLDYKDQYILKCIECNEYYELLESLISHSIDHYQKKFNIEDWPIDTDEIKGVAYKCHELDEAVPTTIENFCVTEGVDPLNSIKWECEEDTKDPIIKEEPTLDSNVTEDDLDYRANTDEETNESSDDTDSEDMETKPKPSRKSGIKSGTFTSSFMKSKINVTAMISAYKKQPKLWNSNIPHVKTHDRHRILQEIAKELKNEINVDLSYAQVGAIITHMRYTFKVKLKCKKIMKNDTKTWYLEQLSFLRPFMEDNSIAILDTVHPDLSREHLIQILGIYNRYPNLWNTSLIENCCENKRIEAFGAMIDDIQAEVGLQIDLNTLKEYVEAVHACVTKEKQKELENNNTDDRSEYYIHMQFLYDHVGPFKCAECDRKFKNPLTFKIHKSQHDGSPALICSLCQKEFKMIGSYAAHARRHMEDLKIECKECGKRFLNNYVLKIHMRCHTGIKPFCCEICGASFRHVQTFNIHKKRHEKRYMHSCPICSKGFITKSSMDDHVRSHKNLREFSCKTCGKTFIRKKTLSQHEVTHDDARKHACALCGKTFKLKIGVTQHMKTHGSIVEGSI